MDKSMKKVGSGKSEVGSWIIWLTVLCFLTSDFRSPTSAFGQTHTFPGNNVFPSTSTTDFNAGATVDFTGATVTGLAAGGTGTVTSITATAPIIVTPSPLVATGVISLNATSKSNWDTAFSERNQWDGGATGLVAATGRSSLALVVGTNVQAWDTDLDVWATKTPYAGAVTVTTAKTFNCTNNLTLSGTDGSTLNVGAGGTLGTAAFTAATAYQAADTDLTTWAGITPVAAVGTWIATPSSANLRSAMTDENGTGAALFSGATTPDFTTGFTIGAAAGAGKIPIGNGTNYVPSTPTFPTTAGTAGYNFRSDGTNFSTYPMQITNSSTANLTTSTSDIYLTGSNCVVTAGDFKAKGQYRCTFDMAKTAGTGAIVISVRVGTLATTGDAAVLTFTFGAGTSVADSGLFDVWVTFRTVGSGTSAVVVGSAKCVHTLATTGLINNANVWPIVGTVSSGFASNTATNIGVSFNGSTAFAGTNTLVQAQLQQ
jgi:hypothetical protein